ncbi:MAG: hypothetical protein KC486_29640, partial [Myxococcales bacterium]|nr:hypothetical protein [Myxococcales bacterium]
ADPTSTGESSTTATTSTSSTSGGGAPCKSDDDCGSNQFCDFPDVLCGAGNPGSCAPRPTECNDNEALTFGCDCLEYASPCLAQMAGTDVRGNIIDCD